MPVQLEAGTPTQFFEDAVGDVERPELPGRQPVGAPHEPGAEGDEAEEGGIGDDPDELLVEQRDERLDM